MSPCAEIKTLNHLMVIERFARKLNDIVYRGSISTWLSVLNGTFLDSH